MNQKQNITKDLDAIAPADPMEYYRKFGNGTGIGLSVSDSLCDEPAERLHGLLQTEVPERGRYACAYLNPAEMRELASELFNLASIIEAENLVLENVKPSKWNHTMDVSFGVANSPHENWEDVPYDDIIASLESRVQNLKHYRYQGTEPFGFCDTIEEQEERK
jgi:hypothetical protein